MNEKLKENMDCCWNNNQPKALSKIQNYNVIECYYLTNSIVYN